ncbi:hydrolase-like protein family isoform X2 [Wolffia australiana]
MNLAFVTAPIFHRYHGPIVNRCSFDLTLQNFGAKSRTSYHSDRSLHASSLEAMDSYDDTRCQSDDALNAATEGQDHLLVLVHGILASPKDWLYAESELKKQLGSSFLIYASSCNTFIKTFNGVDGAGRRLADEVKDVVQKSKGLKKISFLAHSLGGLFSRYAVAVLYSPESGTVGGLQPINFITLATPHLGVRGRKQLPFLLGVPLLEKLAPPLAPFLVGRTGLQLFLTDGKNSKPPLLLRMASDNYELKFLSSLGAFDSRIVYANVAYDHMVGWRTSSIRRETELVKAPRVSLEGYKHVVGMECCPPVVSEDPHFTSEAVKAEAAAKQAPNTKNTNEYHHLVEEEMIYGLQGLGWTKVDVSFHSALWPFFAHNHIHVKNEWLHNEGAGVIAHVAQRLKPQYIPSSL